MSAITDAPPATMWSEEELAAYKADYQRDTTYTTSFSAYNPTPGTGRTGFLPVPPNNYPFYSEEARYKPVVQADGGQLSEWQPMYAPSKEQADADRAAAFASGVPHGYVAPGAGAAQETLIELTVISELHDDDEYGSVVGPDGRRSGGPFSIRVSPKTRVEELRRVIRDAGGILPALQRLSYAGKHLDDAQRTLEQYGVAYWHAKFPHWPLRIRKY